MEATGWWTAVAATISKPYWSGVSSALIASSARLGRCHYKVGNPFEWMETISLQGKTNFVEKRVGEYAKSGVGVDRADQTFALDASF
jgi:ribonucleoside-diphosphate reductase subunit M2